MYQKKITEKIYKWNKQNLFVELENQAEFRKAVIFFLKNHACNNCPSKVLETVRWLAGYNCPPLHSDPKFWIPSGISNIVRWVIELLTCGYKISMILVKIKKILKQIVLHSNNEQKNSKVVFSEYYSPNLTHDKILVHKTQ